MRLASACAALLCGIGPLAVAAQEDPVDEPGEAPIQVLIDRVDDPNGGDPDAEEHGADAADDDGEPLRDIVAETLEDSPHEGVGVDQGHAPRLIRQPLEGERGSDEPITERRQLPDYDGRPDPKPTPGERALWIPRVLLAPVYAVNEYVLRRPLGAIALLAEQNDIGAKIANAFTFGTGGRAGIFPTALFDFGLRPSVGLYLFARDVPRDGERFGVHFAWGGEDWWRVSVRERLILGGDRDVQNTPLSATRLNFHFVYDRRPDHLLSGEVFSDEDDIYAFQWARLGGAVDLEVVFGALDAIEIGVGAYRHEFADGDDIEKADAPLFDAFGTFASPRDAADAIIPGFDGYASTVGHLALNLDSRDPDASRPGSGVRAHAWSDIGVDVDDPDAVWANWGATLGLFGDVNGMRRVVSLNQRVQFNEELGDAPTPFTELPTLGGIDGLRGYVDGRVRAPSTWLTTLQYTYPVWAFMDGFVFYEIGNGFGPHLEGMAIDAMLSSFGIGVRSNADRDAAFSLLVGAGTTAFDADDYAIDSVRITIGTARGF